MLETTGCCSMNKSDLQMGLHFYQQLQVPSSATAKGCSSRPVDCSPTELAAVDFKEGNDTVFIPFPLIFIFSPFPEFCFIPDTNLCCQGSGDARDLEGGSFQDFIRLS